jgi:hypothetical protein
MIVKHVGPTPPEAKPGVVWQDSASGHTAIFGPDLWKPLWPATDNLAVLAANA